MDIVIGLAISLIACKCSDMNFCEAYTFINIALCLYKSISAYSNDKAETR